MAGAESAIAEIIKAAKNGDAKAQFELVRFYQFGDGFAANVVDAEAVKWYRKVAEQGNVWAQSELGDCYRYGRGAEKNESEAVKWYRKAAEQGKVEAQYSLGDCYRRGKGVEKNGAEAVKWYRMVAEQGNAIYSQLAMAQLRRAEQGNAEAQNRQGVKQKRSSWQYYYKWLLFLFFAKHFWRGWSKK